MPAAQFVHTAMGMGGVRKGASVESAVAAAATAPTAHVGHTQVPPDGHDGVGRVAAAPQNLQEKADESGMNPAAHGVHGVVCAMLGLTDPAAHGMHAVAAERRFAYVPAGHGVHTAGDGSVAASAPPETDPAGHGRGADFCALGYVPAAVGVHAVAPSDENHHGGHGSHATVVETWYVPAIHKVHTAAPGEVEHAAEPGVVEHATHAAAVVCVVLRFADPAGHATLKSSPTQYQPAGHGLHVGGAL